MELLEKFEIFLIQKDLTNAYVTQLMKSMKGFFNWATKKGYNHNMAYNDYKPQFRDDSKKSGRSNNFLRSILAKYGPTENPEERVFPQISNQKFNEQMKIVGQLAGLTDDWKITCQVGNKVDDKVVPRYAKLSSHLGRHTFTSRASSLGAPSETIRSITGPTSCPTSYPTSYPTSCG